jgi:hypothetical protein
MDHDYGMGNDGMDHVGNMSDNVISSSSVVYQSIGTEVSLIFHEQIPEVCVASSIKVTRAVKYEHVYVRLFL